MSTARLVEPLACRAVQIRLLRAVCCILLQFEFHCGSPKRILTVEDWVEDWVEDKCQYCGTEMRAAIFHGLYNEA